MEHEQFLEILRQALLSIHEPRFFKTERGYQGELLARIHSRLEAFPIWPGAPVIEQEYQKNADIHGLSIRPDIIIHHPFERRIFADRRQGNFVVIELKRRSSSRAAVDDYTKLGSMCTVLNYARGIFINIDASDTFLSRYNGVGRERLYGFAVRLRNGQIQIHEAH